MLISYEDNGFPVELTSDRDVERAIRQGKLKPDTVVREHRADGSTTTARASDVAALSAHFGDPAPPAAVAVAPAPAPAPAPVSATSAPAVAATAPEPVAPEPAPRAAVPPPPVAEPPMASYDEAFAPPARSGGRVWIVIGVALVALLVALFLTGLLARGPDTTANVTAAATPQPTDVVGTEQEYYVSRTVTVRRLPDATAAALGKLARGDALRGITVRGPDGEGAWVRIEGGRYDGAYVWAINLADDARPALETIFANEERRIAVARPSYASPSFSATAGDTLAVGSVVRVAGRTADGWWEIALKGGGVGYLPSDAIATACVGADCRIVDAKGWGGIVAGMTIAEAEAASGLTLDAASEEGGVDPEPDGTVACSERGLVGGPSALGVMVENGRITSVTISGGDGTAFKTDRGIGIGDSEAALRAAYPQLDQKPDIYSEPPDKKLFYRAGGGFGIKFSINGGKVSSMTVGGGSIEYVEGCL